VARGQLEQRLLVLVTLGLVAFGLVMVYSATSAAAAVGGGNPSGFLERQGVYAVAGLALMIVLARFDYHRLRVLAPALVVTALALCVAVPRRRTGDQRRPPLAAVRTGHVPALGARQGGALHLDRRSTSPAGRRRARSASSAKPVGLLTIVFCGL
jgi:hypothetical protein